jgi:FkbM family methyltransferase
MISSAFRVYRVAQYSRVVKSPGTLWVLSRFPKLETGIFAPGHNGSRLLIRGTDIDPTLNQFQFLLRGSDRVSRLLCEAKANFKALPDGVLVQIGAVNLKLQSWEELFIATEVFVEGIYNLQIPGDFVLIDIGTNVGTTALYFAERPACKFIYGFEPFPKTIAKAEVNLRLNPQLASKIDIRPHGLAARSFSCELDYFEEYKGSVGVNGLPKYVAPDPKKLAHEKVKVNFLAGAEAIAEIAAKHKGTNLICKMDCEGAEYELLESLAAANQLKGIAHFMIEWHQKGPAPIERLLADNGFCYLSFSPHASTFSMIYASRQTGVGPVSNAT